MKTLPVACCLGFAIVLLAAGCSSQPTLSTPAASTQPLIPAGDLQEDQIHYQFAIYYSPTPSAEPLAELDRLLKEQQLFHRAEKVEGKETQPTLAARVEADPQQQYAPPDLDSLKYFGRGLTREQAEALQKTQQALLLDFAYPKAHCWTGMQAALHLSHDLAVATGGLLWDESTREVFSPTAWQERRLAGWSDGVPDISKHTVIHAYQKEPLVRAITLGMDKFGLPDLVADQFPWSLNRNVGHTLNLFAQALAEGAALQKEGEFDLDIRAIKHPGVRDPQVTTLEPNATGVALLKLRQRTPDEGDPANRLVEITFERGTGPDRFAQQQQVLSAAFGFEDNVAKVKHEDEELQAASRRARAELPRLQQEFAKGLAPGEYLQVKTPFDTPDGGHEYMWVEVAKWEGDKITGLLSNEPLNIPTLHGGQEVTVSAKTIFDYLRRHADGTTEGNETSKVIERIRK